MKKLIYFLFSLPFIGTAQEQSYTIQGALSGSNSDFSVSNEHVFLVNYSGNDYLPSINKVPFDGSSGLTKHFDFPNDFIGGYSCSMVKCNLSNHFILSYYSVYNNRCIVLKVDENLNIIWSKLLSYANPEFAGDYGSNSSPLSVNAQDEITITLTPYSMTILTKLSPNGQLLASKSIQSTDNEDGKNPGFSVITTSDLGYLITMKNSSSPTITKVNSSLEMEWSKKWNIDSYSHPKTSLELPNGHFFIVGEGDFGTYIAEIDQNGNVLSYKAGMSMTFPYKAILLPNNDVQIFDTNGNSYTTDFYSSSGTKKLISEPIFGIPRFSGTEHHLLDPTWNNLYLNIESNEKDCFDFYEQNISLFEIEVDPNTITNENIIVADFGEIANYVTTATTSNSLYITENCISLSTAEIQTEIGNLYPNPSTTNQTVTLALNNSTTAFIEIVNTSGQVLETINCSNMKTVHFSLNQSTGLYFIRGLDKNQGLIGTQKLIIE